MQKEFSFHACLGPETSQADVMALCGIQQLLDAALAGYHVTIFAYGQTGEQQGERAVFITRSCVCLGGCHTSICMPASMLAAPCVPHMAWSVLHWCCQQHQHTVLRQHPRSWRGTSKSSRAATCNKQHQKCIFSFAGIHCEP
jgi:hypothetical protein